MTHKPGPYRTAAERIPKDTLVEQEPAPVTLSVPKPTFEQLFNLYATGSMRPKGIRSESYLPRVHDSYDTTVEKAKLRLYHNWYNPSHAFSAYPEPPEFFIGEAESLFKCQTVQDFEFFVSAVAGLHIAREKITELESQIKELTIHLDEARRGAR